MTTARSRRAAAAAAALALATLAGAAGAAPQMFKCVEGGRTVYQQQGCAVSAQADVTSAPRAAARASAGGDATSALARGLRQPSSSASSATATRR
jgi:hypothetical protein